MEGLELTVGIARTDGRAEAMGDHALHKLSAMSVRRGRADRAGEKFCCPRAAPARPCEETARVPVIASIHLCNGKSASCERSVTEPAVCPRPERAATRSD